MKCQSIDPHRRSYPVRRLCQGLRVSTSGYYAARSRPLSARDERQMSLTSHIRAIHTASRYTYGAPRIHAELSAQGVDSIHYRKWSLNYVLSFQLSP